MKDTEGKVKRIIVVILAFAFTLLPAQYASAHVLSEDETKSKGALLHIMPEDNPEAGQVATIYFDLKGFEDETITEVTLDVSNGDTVLATLQLELKDTTASGAYTFQTAGEYELKLDVHTSDDIHSFVFKQVVTGTQTNLAAQLGSYWWALLLLVVCSIAVGVLIVLFVIKRKDISKRSVGV